MGICCGESLKRLWLIEGRGARPSFSLVAVAGFTPNYQTSYIYMSMSLYTHQIKIFSEE